MIAAGGARSKDLDASSAAGYCPRMTENSKPTVHRPVDDPLGYDTRRPFREVAQQMAEDALAGRHQDSIDAELEAVRKRWGMRR